MSASVIEAAVVPTLDPDRQAAAERLARLLASDGAEPPLRVAIEREPRPGCWFLTADGPAVRVDMVGGRAAAIHPDRVDDAIAALDALEPLLDRVEALTGWVVEPEAAAAAAPADAIVLRVEADGHRFGLAVPPPLWGSFDAASAPGAALMGVPLPTALVVRAAHLSVEDAGALGPGDLVLLHPGPWTAALRAGPAGDLTVHYDPVTGAAAPGRVEGGGEVGDGVEGLRGFRVPVEIRLEGASATLEELAALREGGALALGPLTAGLRVDLSVGGRAIASGEVVKLADRYAVLVERVPTEGAG